MNQSFFTLPHFILLFAAALPALQPLPAAAADAGSGSFVGTIEKKPYSVTFKDVYAFRTEASDKKPVTVVILSESPMDKNAMTAALKKERRIGTIDDHMGKMAYARLDIDQDGVKYLFLWIGGRNVTGGPDKADIKINTAKRVEGSASDNTSIGEVAGKTVLRFATDLADIGAPIGR